MCLFSRAKKDLISPVLIFANSKFSKISQVLLFANSRCLKISTLQISAPKKKELEKDSWIKGHLTNASVKINRKTSGHVGKIAVLTNIFFCIFIFAKYVFCGYLAWIYFCECRLKKNLVCISFCDMTKVQEIRENIRTQKLVRLRYVLVLRTMLLQREFVLRRLRLFGWCKFFFCSCLLRCGKHWTKYSRMPFFTDWYSCVSGQNRRFCTYTGEYGSVKTRILSYFMQWKHWCVMIVNSYSDIWNIAIYNFDIVSVLKFWKFDF